MSILLEVEVKEKEISDILEELSLKKMQVQSNLIEEQHRREFKEKYGHLSDEEQYEISQGEPLVYNLEGDLIHTLTEIAKKQRSNHFDVKGLNVSVVELDFKDVIILKYLIESIFSPDVKTTIGHHVAWVTNYRKLVSFDCMESVELRGSKVEMQSHLNEITKNRNRDENYGGFDDQFHLTGARLTLGRQSYSKSIL